MKNSDFPDLLLNALCGGRPPGNYESNGCTNAPDKFGEIDVSAACHFHDYHYDLGGNEIDRRIADQRFRANLKECIAFYDGSTTLYAIAGVYFRRVRFWGVQFFNYQPRRTQAKKLCYMAVSLFRRWFE